MEICLFSLIGQGVLSVLPGMDREKNVFYLVLKTLASPAVRFEDSALMRTLMTPGLWLQKITTQPPDRSQIEVAIASFNEVLRAEAEAGVAASPQVAP